MNLGLDNKVAIVTGASAGLGKAIALSLATEGVNVAISGRRRATLEEAAQAIEMATENQVLPFTGDMTEPDSVKRFIAAVIAAYGTIHILVNNVGQAMRGQFTVLDHGAWHQTFDINLMSAVYLTTNVVPYMQKRKWGRIINIAALSAKEPATELIASNAMKSGLVSFSKTLSHELASDNILVNSISPGLLDSPQNDRYFSPAEYQAALTQIPLGRFGRPEEFADIVTFLCSERASYVTGVNLLVDGGASRGL